MKYILLILIMLITGCTPLAAEPVIETIVETEIVKEYVEIENTDEIDRLNEELDRYKELLNNLNDLLKNVYYVYQGKDDGSSSWGTGFAIEYNGKHYLITAGHVVDSEYGIFKNLGFKDFEGEWIYPELLDYNNDYMNKKDYAILSSSKIDNGFNVDLDNDKPLFIIGDNNLISNYSRKTVVGESGSPVIDIDGEATEVVTTDIYQYNTDIDIVLQAIDNLK
ncbi:MAG: serine protease [Clostridiaceae bacterium]|nr:serine protease [Clostridiaceae bacterium]